MICVATEAVENVVLFWALTGVSCVLLALSFFRPDEGEHRHISERSLYLQMKCLWSGKHLPPNEQQSLTSLDTHLIDSSLYLLYVFHFRTSLSSRSLSLSLLKITFKSILVQ